MNPVVVYYSRTGTTKKVAEYFTEQLKCPAIEVIDLKNRKGILGFIFGGRDAMKRKLTEIDKLKDDVFKYDLVIVGTPVWGSNITPAIRTFLTQNQIKQVAFFATAGSNPGLTFYELEKLSSEPKATLTLTTHEVKLGKFKDKANEFLKKLALI